MQRLLVLASLAVFLAACGHGRPTPTATPAPIATPPPPPNTDVLVSRARALRAAGDEGGARMQLEEALAAAPADAAARLELAELLVHEERDLDRAAALLAPLADGGEGRVELARGGLAEARGDDEAAAASYGAALAASDDPEVRMRRALALERLGRSADELVELERLRATRPGDPFVRTHLAEVYETTGRLAEAEAELRWLAEQQPDRRVGWDRLASFYERVGRRRDARAAAERARAVAGPRPERALRPLLPSRN